MEVFLPTLAFWLSSSLGWPAPEYCQNLGCLTWVTLYSWCGRSDVPSLMQGGDGSSEDC